MVVHLIYWWHIWYTGGRLVDGGGKKDGGGRHTIPSMEKAGSSITLSLQLQELGNMD